MESIQIKNLKSLNDSGVIKIRPITVFVGQNSCGKSSFIRCFPLFKQSAESKILGTILWSGKYVDYGSFDESMNYQAKANGEKEVSFKFIFKNTSLRYGQSSLVSNALIELTVSVSGDEYSKNSYTDITYATNGSVFSIRYSSDSKILSLTINGVDFTKQASEIYRPFKVYTIIPVLTFSTRQGLLSEGQYLALAKEMRQHVHHRTSDEKVRRISRSLRFQDADNTKKALTNKALVGDYAATKISDWKTTDLRFKRIRDQIIFSNLTDITDQIADVFRAHFSSARYITPLRAAADRYYRIQNISTEALDPNGSNLAMFLYAKKDSEIEELNEWLNAEIGFSIVIERSRGHASIFIVDGAERTNIADTGFGISQILPVLIQVWQQTQRQMGRSSAGDIPKTIIIEQPELHLHPKMQSRIGSIFCKAIKMAKNVGVDYRIIIETHSKDIIDAIGKAIDEKVLDKADAAVYLVDKKKEVNVSESYFNDEGFLQEWPYGFFDGE